MDVGFLLAWLRSVIRRDPNDGQSLVEYALILALIVVVVIIIVMTLGNQTKNLYCNISGGLGS